MRRVILRILRIVVLLPKRQGVAKTATTKDNSKRQLTKDNPGGITNLTWNTYKTAYKDLNIKIRW